jgi:hypothetical protein
MAQGSLVLLPSRKEDSMDPQPPEPDRVRVKNRRQRFLLENPSYFGSSLELADPLLYDRLVRRFQTTAEREAEGREKGYSGVLEADLQRSEAKLHALKHPDPNATFTYKRGPDGEILEEERDEVPLSKEEGLARWRFEMEMRFIRGDDADFDYKTVDDNDAYDDHQEEERQRLEDYLDLQEPEWDLEEGQRPQGETGVQDY